MGAAASEPLDPEVVASLIELGEEGGESILKVLAGIFIHEEGPACLSRIEAAFQAGDLEDLAEGAHKLKGGAAQLGAGHLRQLCADLESQSRGGDISNAADLLRAISAEIARVYAALEAEVTALGH
ncbi:MAG TPA: Hpt domain-containing protein [Chloroflexota bacterium]|nr:Hpt domain-containing protein [Chloroflexota bacterium]